MANGIGSEQKLIEMITRRLAVRGEHIGHWIGDDASVVRGQGDIVTSIDAFVDGVHFSSDWPMDAIGHKAMAAAISDIAAMGARPGEAFVALGVDNGMRATDIDEIYLGMEKVTEACGVTICGGDLSRAGQMSIVVSINGWVKDAKSVVTRAGARTGDIVCVTGSLGGAGAGLKLLEGVETKISQSVHSELVKRQQRPNPQVELGMSLSSSGATSMIDLSDGLASDAGHLAKESDATLVIELDSLPLQSGVSEVAAELGRDAREFAAEFGEDYELLATVPPALKNEVESAVVDAGGSLTWIGVVEDGKGLVQLIDSDSKEVQLTGFDHFS